MVAGSGPTEEMIASDTLSESRPVRGARMRNRLVRSTRWPPPSRRLCR
jgi:hypothetical protein